MSVYRSDVDWFNPPAAIPRRAEYLSVYVALGRAPPLNGASSKLHVRLRRGVI